MLRLTKIVTSGQDGGIGRHTVPPHTTKRRTTTDLKTENDQNWWKIKLYGSPTTKELKKKHSSRPVGGAEMGSRVERTHGKMVASRRSGAGKAATDQQGSSCRTRQGSGWRTRSHIRVQINWEEQWGSETDHATQGSSVGGKSLKPLIENTCGGWGSNGRNSQPHRRVRWWDLQGPRMYTIPPTWESAPERPNLLVDSGGNDWNPTESGASGIVPSRTPPPQRALQRSTVGRPALVNT